MIYPRTGGRLGEQMHLNAGFYHNGQPAVPFAIRQIDIYQGCIRPENIVATIPIPNNLDPTYPFPIIVDSVNPGSFDLVFSVPETFVPGVVYFDVWHYVGNDPGTGSVDDESLWISQYGTFYVFDDVWLVDADLQNIDIGFEPLDKNLRRGEIKQIEVALHPLPLYEYNFNAIEPLIPLLSPTITIHTANNELLSGLVDAPCKIGIRQGANRNSPYVVQCLIDTKTMLRGTYKYSIKVNMRNKVIVSDNYFFTVQ